MEEVNENVRLFRNRYAPELEINDSNLFFLMIEKIKELKGESTG